jgi:hypothetical protein
MTLPIPLPLPLSSTSNSNNFNSALTYFTLLSTPTKNTMATAEVGYQTQSHDHGKHDLGKKQTHMHGNGHNDVDHHHTRAISQSTDSSKNGNGNHKVTYEDPNADVALRSSDGRIFKVESYVLKAHS